MNRVEWIGSILAVFLATNAAFAQDVQPSTAVADGDSGGPPAQAEAAAAAPSAEQPSPDNTIIANTIGMLFRRIEPGSFVMGSARGEAEERPPHKVTLTKPFLIGVYEVTQEQWEAVMGTNPSHFKNPQHPVENVSWNDAKQFCARLSQREVATYRLPTEAEWEYACRAGTTTEHYWGDTFDEAYAWCVSNSEGTSHPVGAKKPNPWGLYDMSGNVYEWCEDSLGAYPAEEQTDPLHSAASPWHVDRGGCWFNRGEYCRSADRGGRLADFRDFFVGFRVVLEKQTDE